MALLASYGQHTRTRSVLRASYAGSTPPNIRRPSDPGRADDDARPSKSVTQRNHHSNHHLDILSYPSPPEYLCNTDEPQDAGQQHQNRYQDNHGLHSQLCSSNRRCAITGSIPQPQGRRSRTGPAPVTDSRVLEERRTPTELEPRFVHHTSSQHRIRQHYHSNRPSYLLAPLNALSERTYNADEPQNMECTVLGSIPQPRHSRSRTRKAAVTETARCHLGGQPSRRSPSSSRTVRERRYNTSPGPRPAHRASSQHWGQRHIYHDEQDGYRHQRSHPDEQDERRQQVTLGGYRRDCANNPVLERTNVTWRPSGLWEESFGDFEQKDFVSADEVGRDRRLVRPHDTPISQVAPLQPSFLSYSNPASVSQTTSLNLSEHSSVPPSDLRCSPSQTQAAAFGRSTPAEATPSLLSIIRSDPALLACHQSLVRLREAYIASGLVVSSTLEDAIDNPRALCELFSLSTSLPVSSNPSSTSQCPKFPTSGRHSDFPQSPAPFGSSFDRFPSTYSPHTDSSCSLSSDSTIPHPRYTSISGPERCEDWDCQDRELPHRSDKLHHRHIQVDSSDNPIDLKPAVVASVLEQAPSPSMCPPTASRPTDANVSALPDGHGGDLRLAEASLLPLSTGATDDNLIGNTTGTGTVPDGGAVHPQMHHKNEGDLAPSGLDSTVMDVSIPDGIPLHLGQPTLDNTSGVTAGGDRAPDGGGSGDALDVQAHVHALCTSTGKTLCRTSALDMISGLGLALRSQRVLELRLHPLKDLPSRIHTAGHSSILGLHKRFTGTKSPSPRHGLLSAYGPVPCFPNQHAIEDSPSRITPLRLSLGSGMFCWQVLVGYAVSPKANTVEGRYHPSTQFKQHVTQSKLLIVLIGSCRILSECSNFIISFSKFALSVHCFRFCLFPFHSPFIERLWTYFIGTPFLSTLTSFGHVFLRSSDGGVLEYQGALDHMPELGLYLSRPDTLTAQTITTI